MSFQISIDEIFRILEQNPSNLTQDILKTCVTKISTDSREVEPGQLFLAVVGDNFDGHSFIQKAVDQGAVAIVCNSPSSVISTKKIPQIIVEDTLNAYQKIANEWRNKFEIPIIGITGSVGKTTTKELIAAVLGTVGKVHKTQANYNNEIGVPKTLLELTPHHDYAVIEMAMRAREEIALLTQITQPTIGVITNVGTAHIGRLGSEQAIAEAKCELLREMPSSAMAILNQDNERLINTAANFWQGQTLTYGLEGGDLQGTLIDPQTLQVEGMTFPLPLAGRHNALNYLAALAVMKHLNLDWEPLTQGISVQLPQGRSQQYQLPNDIMLLDETYNAGLESMEAALHLLKTTPGKRHLAVLGTMKELGEKSAELHRRVGETAKRLGIDGLYILVDDPQAKAIADGATGIPCDCLETHQDLIQQLIEQVEPGDRLLFKASNSVGLNRVVTALRQALTP